MRVSSQHFSWNHHTSIRGICGNLGIRPLAMQGRFSFNKRLRLTMQQVTFPHVWSSRIKNLWSERHAFRGINNTFGPCRWFDDHPDRITAMPNPPESVRNNEVISGRCSRFRYRPVPWSWIYPLCGVASQPPLIILPAVYGRFDNSSFDSSPSTLSMESLGEMTVRVRYRKRTVGTSCGLRIRYNVITNEGYFTSLTIVKWWCRMLS